MQNKVSTASIEDIADMAGASAPSIDLLAILRAVLRRWKLVAAITLVTSMATYGVVKLLVPSRYKSTVEILVYDPQQQIDAAIQKPISPFVDAVGGEAMNTEINVLKSKSVALRVASELGLDTDPEFQSQGLRIRDLVKRLGLAELGQRLGIADLGERLGIADLCKRLGLSFPNGTDDNGGTDEKADRLDRAADALIDRLQIWPDSYVIFVSATARDPSAAQRLASTVANVYLENQREARQEALEHVAAWLKSRIDELQSHVLETEASIDKLKVESGFRDSELDKVKEQQIHEINSQLVIVRQDVNDKRAYLQLARRVINNHGDIDSIPELTASGTLAELRRTKMQLSLNLAELQNKFGEHSPAVISVRGELATLSKQMEAEVEKHLGSVESAYDIAVQRQQSLEANLQSLTADLTSQNYVKLQQLRRAAEADRKDYESYLAQYNNIAEQREMQHASARIISPATLPRSPTSSRMKFYALGAIAGLGGGLLLAFLLEYFKPGVKTGAEIEQSFGVPAVGFVPFVSQRKIRGASNYQPLKRMVNKPFSQLSEAVQAMRVNLELSNANPKVILVTSALSGEGKSTAAMLLAASSASSGKRTILLDCDLHLRSTSDALQRKHHPGLCELLRGTAKLTDVIIEDPLTKTNVIPAGSKAPNAADLLMSQRMLDLIAVLRSQFDYIVIDAPPLLPVVDALALATVADKILMVVEWCQTPRGSIYEAFRVLGPEANRVAGIVLNKVDFNELPGYGGGYHYRSVAKYFGNT